MISKVIGDVSKRIQKKHIFVWIKYIEQQNWWHLCIGSTFCYVCLAFFLAQQDMELNFAKTYQAFSLCIWILAQSVHFWMMSVPEHLSLKLRTAGCNCCHYHYWTPVTNHCSFKAPAVGYHTDSRRRLCKTVSFCGILFRTWKFDESRTDHVRESYWYSHSGTTQREGGNSLPMCLLTPAFCVLGQKCFYWRPCFLFLFLSIVA